MPGLERFGDGDQKVAIDLLEISGRPRLNAVRSDFGELAEVLTSADLREAVERVASLALPIGHFTIATIARRSKALRDAVLAVNLENRAADLFTVEMLCWDDIEGLLDEYPALLTQFEPGPKRQALTKNTATLQLEPRWIRVSPAEASDPARREIGDAAALIDQGNNQLGRLKLMRLREGCWQQLTLDQRMAVLSNLARAWMKDGEVRKAAMLFIAARSLRPDDEDACSNEILAYELLGEKERARVLAEIVCAKFLKSGRAHALLLNNLPAWTTLAELERKTPARLKTDPEVAAVLARRSIAASDYPRAERFARATVEALPAKSDSWLLVGQAILLCEIESNSGAAHEERLREGEACFTRAVAFAREEVSIPNEVQALVGRAHAHIALGDIDGAGLDIEDVHSLGVNDANALCEYAILLRAQGDLSGAVEVFRRAVKAGGRDDAEFHLGVTLRERDLRGDLSEAAEILVRCVLNPSKIPSGDYIFAVNCACDVLSRLEKWHQAEVLLAEIPSDRIPRTAHWTLRARLELSRGETVKASRLADEARASLHIETTPDERRNLAVLLHDLSRYADALTLWESIIEPRASRNDGDTESGALSTDLRRLFDCVRRLGRFDVDREVGLLNLDSIPSACEVAPALGRVAVKLMREADHPDEALRYAYGLLRHNPDDPDAHRALLSVLGPLGTMPTVADFETAQMGCAVCFVEQDGDAERWAILEDAPDADQASGEYGASSSLTKQLRGRRVGERFQLSEGRPTRKSAVIKQLVSKYAYRYQDCLYGFARRFPGLPEIEMVQRDTNRAAEILCDPDAVVKGMTVDGIRDRAHRTYALAPMSIHGYAERVALSDLHGVFSLAAHSDAIIKCCDGSREELDGALMAYHRANSIVLDLSAIATMCLLGALELLRTWPRRFVVSPATLHELRRFQFEESPVLVGNRTGSDLASADVELRGLADLIASTCTVGDGAMVSRLAANRREELTSRFGLHGTEAMLLASKPGHALWTDDRILAGVARSEFGARRIWTQSALMAGVQAGHLDPATLANAGTKLAGWGYSFTLPSLETLMRAGALAGWSVNRFPLKQALDQFATDRIAMSDAVVLAAELIVHVYAFADAHLRSTRTALIARLLDRLAARDGGCYAIDALPRSLPIRYGLDADGARELAEAIHLWKSSSVAIPEIPAISSLEEHSASV